MNKEKKSNAKTKIKHNLRVYRQQNVSKKNEISWKQLKVQVFDLTKSG